MPSMLESVTAAKKFLPYNRQSIDADDIESVVKSLKGDFITTGPDIEVFEKEIAEYVGSKYAAVCSSGTAALHLAMIALDIGKNDSVLTSPITFLADANAAKYVGGTATFADVDPNTINLSPEEVRKELNNNKNIKAIIPVHFGGTSVQLEKFNEISKEFGVKIIEDGCHAFGGSYLDNNNQNIKVGSCKYSSVTIFSFHAIKNITTGEGGCITTNDKGIYEKIKKFRNHGIVKNIENIKNMDLATTEIDNKRVMNPWYYEVQELGYNYRLTDFQCALGRTQLKKVNQFIEKRRKISDVYTKLINDRLLNYVELLNKGKSELNAHHLFVIQIDFKNLKGGRAALMNYLKEQGVGTQVHYIPLHLQPLYNEKKKLPNSETYYSKCLSLPLFSDMTGEDAEYVIDELEKGIELLKY